MGICLALGASITYKHIQTQTWSTEWKTNKNRQYKKIKTKHSKCIMHTLGCFSTFNLLINWILLGTKYVSALLVFYMRHSVTQSRGERGVLREEGVKWIIQYPQGQMNCIFISNVCNTFHLSSSYFPAQFWQTGHPQTLNPKGHNTYIYTYMYKSYRK